jgi:hypothetical protein
MSRASMAFRCFFKLLFRGTLPPEAAEYLPEDARPALPGPRPGARDDNDGEPASKQGDPLDRAAADAAGAGARPGATRAAEPAQIVPPVDDAPVAPRAPARKSASAAEQHAEGVLAFLALLQREGRLVDFLQESLDQYEDSDIGASVRDIHRGLRKVLGDYFEIEPVMPGQEDDPVNVPKGFDPGEVRLVGDVTGQPPFKGVLRHHGWRVVEVKLPTLSEGVDRHVLAPAEVEIA